MTFGSLLIEGERDVGGSLITYFAIPPGREAEVARDLLACLSDGVEVSLRNDLDEGREGVTFFRRTAAGLSSKVGGRGWQGDWEVIDEVQLASAVAELAAHNRGGHWSAQGALIRHKRYAELGATPDPAV